MPVLRNPPGDPAHLPDIRTHGVIKRGPFGWMRLRWGVRVRPLIEGTTGDVRPDPLRSGSI